MFCPECKAEYRPGFTHCSDCDVDLVDELPQPAASGEALDAALPTAWAGTDEGECAAVCDRLQEAEIPFKVVEQAEDFFFGGAGQRFEIRVPSDLLDEARIIAREIAQEIAGQGLTEGDGDESAPELPDEELPDEEDRAAPFDDALDQDSYWDPRNWHPEDATVEVWAGNDQPQAEMIEASLREHRIHTRTDTLDDGSRQVFVMPEQELRAREIVREIVSGTPRQ